MLEALAQGFVKGFDFGPGKVLQGLAKRITSPDGVAIAAETYTIK